MTKHKNKNKNRLQSLNPDKLFNSLTKKNDTTAIAHDLSDHFPIIFTGTITKTNNKKLENVIEKQLGEKTLN